MNDLSRKTKDKEFKITEEAWRLVMLAQNYERMDSGELDFSRAITDLVEAQEFLRKHKRYGDKIVDVLNDCIPLEEAIEILKLTDWRGTLNKKLKRQGMSEDDRKYILHCLKSGNLPRSVIETLQNAREKFQD
jgi:hypothetical protein